MTIAPRRRGYREPGGTRGAVPQEDLEKIPCWAAKLAGDGFQYIAREEGRAPLRIGYLEDPQQYWVPDLPRTARRYNISAHLDLGPGIF